jgi:hypothetical protein
MLWLGITPWGARYFVESDNSVSFADPMFVLDAINALHAKAVILTLRLKEEMAKACPSG